MPDAEKPLFYEFADLRVDVEKRLLRRGTDPISLTPKVFETLLVFLEHRGEVLEKDRLMSLLWADSFVEESNLTQNVAVLRKALGEDSKQHKFVLTIPGRGYRFVAQVKEIFADTSETMRLQAGEFLESNVESAEEGIDEKIEEPVAQRRGRIWLVAIPLALLATGIIAFWLFFNRNQVSVTPVISKTTQITTWSGLVFYPSISPDGNSIAFSSDRNGSFEIYVKHLVAGAREAQITSDRGQNFEPSFSPDGSLLAYYSKIRGGIWVVPAAGGTAKQLTQFGSRPAWSPDGSSIAFQSDSLNDLGPGVRNAMPPSTIWIVASKGGEPRQLTQVGNPAGGHGGPSWSPDGKRIVFDASDLSYSSVWSLAVQGDDLKHLSAKLNIASDAVYAPDGKSILLIADTDTSVQQINLSETGEAVGEPVKIFDSSGSRIRQLSIAVKGKRIAYAALTTASNIWATSLDTNAANGNPIQLTQSANIRSFNPAFLPDGRKIVYQSSLTGTSQIWMMEADGTNQTQLTTDRGWSAWRFLDGNDIAYITMRDDRPALWSFGIGTGKEKKLVDFDEEVINFARISPDGKQVAINSKRSGTLNIWIITIEGGAVKQLTFDKELMGFPAWSPDGRLIAFQMKRGEDTHVAIMPSMGGEAIQLTADKGQSWVYDWSPDGDKILFAGQRDGLWNVYSVSRSTKEQKRLTNFTKLNSYVRYPAWSPLNDKIVYEHAETTGTIWMIELK